MTLRRPARSSVIEDSYEPGTLEEAWHEYCEPRGMVPWVRDERYELFRSGWRRGFGQGSVVMGATFVHTAEPDESGRLTR